MLLETVCEISPHTPFTIFHQLLSDYQSRSLWENDVIIGIDEGFVNNVRCQQQSHFVIYIKAMGIRHSGNKTGRNMKRFQALICPAWQVPDNDDPER